MKINIGKLIDNATQKCGLSTANESPENILRAKESLYFVLLDMFNRGVPIFGVIPKLIGFEPRKWVFDLDPKIMDIFNLNWRQFNHASSTPSGGINPVNLQDYNWATFSSTTTNFTLTLTSSPQYIDYYGIAPYGDQTVSFVIEVQTNMDLNTWVTIGTYTDYILEDGVWLWIDIKTPVNGYAVRLRITDSSTITLRGFFTGNRQAAYEQPCAKMNRDDFFAYPTKGIAGTPINYYYLKDNTPQLQLWQSADGANVFNWCLSLYVLEVPDSEFLLPLELPVPDWYLEGIEWNLAAKIMYMLPNVAPERMTMIEQNASRLMSQMEASNSDSSSFNLLGNAIAGYQRRR